MCDPIGFSVDFAPRLALPDGYEVEGMQGVGDPRPVYYGYTVDLTWFGENRNTKMDARRDVLAHARGVKRV